MRKFTIILMGMLLVSTVCLAKPRNPFRQLDSKTTFGNVEATGQDVGGNPGYLLLIGLEGSKNLPSTQIEYYLWVSIDGDLLMASHAALTAISTASFPNGDWTSFNTDHTGVVKIGGQ